jgi:hypothetical protein
MEDLPSFFSSVLPLTFAVIYNQPLHTHRAMAQLPARVGQQAGVSLEESRKRILRCDRPALRREDF